MSVNYSHSWACAPAHPAYTLRWPGLLADTAAIVRRVGQLGVGVCGPDGFGPALLDAELGIAFNGDGATGRHGTPLLLPAPLRHNQPAPPQSGTCRTGLHPYDLAVTAVLLRFSQILGDGFAIGSHGSWDHEWDHGTRPTLPGPRELVTDLFGDTTTASPLTWSGAMR